MVDCHGKNGSFLHNKLMLEIACGNEPVFYPTNWQFWRLPWIIRIYLGRQRLCLECTPYTPNCYLTILSYQTSLITHFMIPTHNHRHTNSRVWATLAASANQHSAREHHNQLFRQNWQTTNTCLLLVFCAEGEKAISVWAWLDEGVIEYKKTVDAIRSMDGC